MAKPQPQRGPSRLSCALDEAADPREVGGKAANLSRMMALGMPVPPGFALTTAAFELFLSRNDLQKSIEALVASVDPGTPASARAAAESIAQLLQGAAVPAEIAAEIEARASSLRRPLIVRSSAAGEDGASHSFAGQLDSLPDAEGDLKKAVVACWASAWSERSLFYQAARGARLGGVGVVVQEQVRSAISGVLFTRDPGDPGEQAMRVEFCEGPGQRLVSGAITPGALRVDRESLEAELLAGPEGNPGARLEGALLGRLCRLALGLEKSLGGPQDIEWTSDGEGRLFLVQTRPITALGAGQAGRARRRGARAMVWSNANVNENYPEPISPLLYSIAEASYYHYFGGLARSFGVTRERVAAMEHPLRHLIGAHGARMYYNLSNIHAFIALAPGGAALSDFFDQFVGAPSTERPRTIETRGLRRAAELARVAASLAASYAGLTGRIAAFESRVDGYAAAADPASLAGKTDPELLGLFRGFLDIRFSGWEAPALADVAAMISYGLLRRALRRLFPGDERGALHNTLIKGLPGIVSGEPVLALWDLSREARAAPGLLDLIDERGEGALGVIEGEPRFAAFRSQFQGYLRRYGFRRSGELMLTVPGFDEAPGELLGLVARYARLTGESPSQALERQGREREAELASVRAALRSGPLPRPDLAALVDLLVGATHRAIALRERARMKQALLYSRLRRVALAVGASLAGQGRVERADDVFFFTYQEIDAILSSSHMFPRHLRGLVELRREAHRAESSLSPPDTVRLDEGELFEPGAGGPAPGGPDEGGALRGVGACGGRARARAAVLRDLSESDRLGQGDILVTRQTDPGWGPVFFLIKGLVMERGGMLSHGAILAREFGLPAVVGVPSVTARIETGQTVEVDGDRGTVSVGG